MKVEYRRWRCDEKALAGLNAAKARDLIEQCFFEAQKESIVRGKKALDLEVSDASVLESVRTSLQMAFAETGGNFDRPDRESLSRVVEFLARRAKAWGTPPDIIEYHRGQMDLIFSRLR